MNKIPIAEGKVHGNLKDIVQVYRINYMPKEITKEKTYDAKIELAILLEKDGLQEGAYRSLRFTNNAQLKSFIVNLIKAYIFMGKQTGEINPYNFIYKIEQFNKLIMEEVRR